MTQRGQSPRQPARRGVAKGALEPREDKVSAYWTLGITGLFTLILVLAFLGLPSRFFAGATATPLPSVPVSPSVSIPIPSSLEVIPPSVSPSVTPVPSPAT